MRIFRWLLLVAIAVIAAGVFQRYRLERIAGKVTQRPAPAPLAIDTKASARHWEWGKSANGMPAVYLKANGMRQTADSKMVELEGIELLIYQKDGKHYDKVSTEHASFSTADNKLFAPGEAEITLDVPATGEPTHALTSIKASRINFDSQSGQAFSDQHVTFTFEDGSGSSDGASYSPQSHEIHLQRSVVLNLKGKNPKARPTKVDADELTYNETEATVRLGQHAKMTRDQSVLEAGATVVKLKDRKIDTIDAPAAHGTDKQSGRNLEYLADLMHAQYNDQGEMEKLEGTGNAKLVSHTRTAETTMTGGRLNLFFKAGESDSVLTSAQARGNAFLESKPVPDPKGLTADTRSMRADSVDLFMRPDGRELDHVSTLAPGKLEFMPNQATRSRRIVSGDRMLVSYGENNEIQSFHADTATTETYPSKADVAKDELAKKKPAEVALTSSKTMDAMFDDKGQLKEIRQAGNFRYSEGARKAQSDTATMDNAKNVMDLDAHARVADDTGSTAANHIRIEPATGDFDATGAVATTRLPDQKPAPVSAAPTATTKEQAGMLDPGEATQGKADHVFSSNKGQILHYVDHAVVWQGASKIVADRIDIDREKKALTADGHVVSQLQDSVKTPPPGTTAKAALPVTTTVRSEKMIYTDTNRLAVYSGGVTLLRTALHVKSETLQAFLNDGKPVDGKTPDSRIDHALADGAVEIVQSSPARTRVGTGDHGEYFTGEGKVTLTGGNPTLKDSKKATVTGQKLTYYTDDDKLIIDGTPQQQVKGHIVKGKS